MVPPTSAAGSVMKITARMAAQEAAVSLRRFQYRLPSSASPPICVPMSGPVGQFFSGAWITPQDLDLPIEEFCDNFVRPCMADIASKLPADTKFAPYPLEMPKGMISVGTADYRGAHVRCVITEYRIPEGTPDTVWRSHHWFYDLQEDTCLFCDVGLVIRFDVATVIPEKAAA